MRGTFLAITVAASLVPATFGFAGLPSVVDKIFFHHAVSLPAVSVTCFNAYCNHPNNKDLQAAFCEGRACSTMAEAQACHNHWQHYGAKEHRAGDPEHCHPNTSVDGNCFLAYCNAHPHLKESLCKETRYSLKRSGHVCKNRVTGLSSKQHSVEACAAHVRSQDRCGDEFSYSQNTGWCACPAAAHTTCTEKRAKGYDTYKLVAPKSTTSRCHTLAEAKRCRDQWVLIGQFDGMGGLSNPDHCMPPRVDACSHGAIWKTGSGSTAPGSCCPGNDRRSQGSCSDKHANMYDMTTPVCWANKDGMDDWGYCVEDPKCFLAYCNHKLNHDLRFAFCEGWNCTTARQAHSCRDHWFQFGRDEMRPGNPEACMAPPTRSFTLCLESPDGKCRRLSHSHA